jgi:hypothetical protein
VRADVESRDIRVFIDQVDIVEFDTEGFRRDLREGRADALADVAITDNERTPAVRIEFECGVAVLKEHRLRAAQPAHGRDAYPSPDRAVRRHFTPFFLPSDFLGPDVETLVQSAACDLRHGKPAEAAYPAMMFFTEFDRIHAEFLAGLVDEGLARKTGLRTTEAPHRAAGQVVRVTHLDFLVHAFKLVFRDIGCERYAAAGSDLDHMRARVSNIPCTAGLGGAILEEAQFHPDPRDVLAGETVGEILASGIFEFDRRACLHGEGRRQVLGTKIRPGAESAARVRLNDPHLGLGQIEDECQHPLREVGKLRLTPDGEASPLKSATEQAFSRPA